MYPRRKPKPEKASSASAASKSEPPNASTPESDLARASIGSDASSCSSYEDLPDFTADPTHHVMRQIELLGDAHVGYRSLKVPSKAVVIVGARPFSEVWRESMCFRPFLPYFCFLSFSLSSCLLCYNQTADDFWAFVEKFHRTIHLHVPGVDECVGGPLLQNRAGLHQEAVPWCGLCQGAANTP